MAMWIGDRISVEDNQELTTIVINPLRVKWKEILLMCWVAGFTFVGFFMIYLLATGFSSLSFKVPPTEEDIDNLVIYGIVFLGFWLYFEYKTVKSLMWYRFGKELLKIDNEGLWIKKSILTYGKSTRYFFENIKDFHQRKQEQTSFGIFFENAFWSLGIDALEFKYQRKTINLGRRLDDKSARLLLRLIDDRVKKRLKSPR
jgi:hypothetical protein